MEVIAALGAWAIATFCSRFPTDQYSISSMICNSGNISTVLGPNLSSGANIYFPDSAHFSDAIDRWSQYKKPNFTVVVEVASENDVAETVKYANANGIPFLAKSGGHGSIAGLEKLDHGIEIWLRQLDSVKISAKGNTATFGGGILSKRITDTLWAAGKQTVTGGCECTSLLGPNKIYQP